MKIGQWILCPIFVISSIGISIYFLSEKKIERIWLYYELYFLSMRHFLMLFAEN